MSKSIDWHEGYIKCLNDIKKLIDKSKDKNKLPSQYFDLVDMYFKIKQEEHTKAIGNILEAMYKAHKES